MIFRIREYMKRARRAEARVRELESKLDAERDLSRMRDAEWADRFLQSLGHFGLKISPVVEAPKPPGPKPEPKLNGIEEAKLEAYKAAAINAGLNAQVGVKQFWAEKDGSAMPFEFVSDGYES